MTYREVETNEIKEKLQDIYKYMPTFINVNGIMVRVIAQQNGIVYYTKEDI